MSGWPLAIHLSGSRLDITILTEVKQFQVGESEFSRFPEAIDVVLP